MKKELIKINGINGAEILSDEQLDNISGGTVEELEDIQRILKDDSIWKWTEKVSERMQKEFGIKVHYDRDNPNKYTDKNGKSLTQKEVLGILRKKYPYKNVF
ncbi:MAG: hypothetical protein IJ774_06035, partial [Selenomonadaceae bacterium]|nr:hypothetical protein [Selenomonadaceae bacterium]